MEKVEDCRDGKGLSEEWVSWVNEQRQNAD